MRDLTLLPSWQQTLQRAQAHAQAARFEDCLATCRQIIDAHGSDPDALLSAGSLLSGFGFLSAARECFAHARSLAPDNPRPLNGAPGRRLKSPWETPWLAMNARKGSV